jgi:hypothetical protein
MTMTGLALSVHGFHHQTLIVAGARSCFSCLKQRPHPKHGVHTTNINTINNNQQRHFMSINDNQEHQTQENTNLIMMNQKTLQELDSCQSATAARRVIQQALNGDSDGSTDTDTDSNGDSNGDGNGNGNDPLIRFDSVQIPPGATDRKTISDAELALMTGIRSNSNSNYKVTELIETNGDRDADRASLFLLCLFVASTGSAVVLGERLSTFTYLGGHRIPEIVRFVVVWVLSFAPLGFVGAGIATPDLVQQALITIQSYVLPSYKKRMIQHEAGHFLLAHLLGNPIQSYRANDSSAMNNAVQFYPLADSDVGKQKAQLLGFDRPRQRRRDDSSSSSSKRNTSGRSGTSYGDNNGEDEVPMIPILEDREYFSKGGRGNDLVDRSVFRDMNKKSPQKEALYRMGELMTGPNDPSQVWPYKKGFDHATLDELSVVSLGGACAEILGFGNAEGAAADISQLKLLLNNAEPPLTESQMETRVRYGIGYGMSLLRRHLRELDALAAVMERQGSIAECVMAIEMTARNAHDGAEDKDADVDVDPRAYEESRKEVLLGSNNPVERFLLQQVLGGGKNAAQTSNVSEGKGGGETQSNWTDSVTDEPFYAAIAVAGLFFLWAANGGLSLH